ncbi:MAG: group II intron maturase-specific domain-containing protein [Pseudomonadota bacterium]
MGKKKFHSLYGQLMERPRLRSAFQRVKSNGGSAGSDGVSIKEYESDLENHPKPPLSYIDQGATFLGYRLTKFKGGLYAVVPKDVVMRFRERVRELTRRNSHLTKGERLKELSRYVRGWGEYYKRAGQQKLFYKLDRWIYRRVIAMFAGRWGNWLFVKYPIRYYRDL